MAYIEQLPNCCGINELGHIMDDESAEHTLADLDYYDLNAHVIFSVTSRETKGHLRGKQLAKLIKDNKLGAIVETKGNRNPGHTGTLKAWLWTPNKMALKRFQAKLKKQKPELFRHDPYRDPYGYW